jgi:hypothetical protein
LIESLEKLFIVKGIEVSYELGYFGKWPLAEVLKAPIVYVEHLRGVT